MKCGTDRRNQGSVAANEGRLLESPQMACNRAASVVNLDSVLTRDGLERASESGSSRATRTDVPLPWDYDR